MLEKYEKLKKENNNYVIIIKSGNFYAVLGEEAYLMNNIFGYQVREFGKYIKAGFPISSKNKITDKFNELKINYIFDNGEKKSFNNNNYNKYIKKNTNIIKNQTKSKEKKVKVTDKIIDRFIITRDIKKTIFYFDKIVSNFPKSEKVLKDRIMDDMYSMLEITYIANSLEERVYQQKKLLAKLKMIDFYTLMAYDKKFISNNQYNQVGNFLLNIIKETNAWIKNEKI